MGGLKFNSGDPVFENLEGIAFCTKGERPNERGEIIDSIH